MLPSRRQYGRLVDRKLIAETGQIPVGLRLLQDTYPFEVIDTKKAITEGWNGKEEPVIRVTGLFQMGDRENANGRLYPTSEVLVPAVRQIQEDVSNRAVPGEYDHPCRTSSDFRVLTVDGWKDFVDIKVGDYVWSRVNGRMVKSCVNRIIDEPYDDTAYRVRNKNINDEFTPGHRFLLEKRPDRDDHSQLYATVADVAAHRKKYSHHCVPQTADYVAERSDVITISGCDDLHMNQSYYIADCGGSVDKDLVVDARLFASFFGLYLAEGGVKCNTVHISQKNVSGRELIAELLEALGFHYKEAATGFFVTDKRLANYLRPLGDRYTKYIPHAIKNLDADCLEALIYWFAVGDGRMLQSSRNSRFLSCKSSIAGGVALEAKLDLGKYSRVSVFTVSRQLIRDLHECVVKTGRCGRLSEVASEDDYVFAGHMIEAKHKSTLYQLHISRRKGFTLDPRFLAIEPFHHIGRIYCLSVDHGNFYMEHNGLSYWTGNCDAKIHLDRVSHLITKVWLEGRKCYGEAEVLHHLPCGACLRGLFEHKVRVGISSRGVGDMEVIERSGQEIHRVMPGYSFVTWDVVAEPSVNGAILNIQEGLNKRIRPLYQNRAKFSRRAYERMVVEEINNFFGFKS